MILAGILGLAARAAQHQLAQDQHNSHTVAAILTARDATMISARVTTGGTATIVMSPRERALVFAAAGLHPLPSSQCYQLWLMGPGGDKPAGDAARPPPRHDRAGARIRPQTRRPPGPDHRARLRVTAPHLGDDPRARSLTRLPLDHRPEAPAGTRLDDQVLGHGMCTVTGLCAGWAGYRWLPASRQQRPADLAVRDTFFRYFGPVSFTGQMAGPHHPPAAFGHLM